MIKKSGGTNYIIFSKLSKKMDNLILSKGINTQKMAGIVDEDGTRRVVYYTLPFVERHSLTFLSRIAIALEKVS
jgi:hypothetical protein